MKPRPGEFPHHGRLAFELLHVILAELAQSQCVGLLYRVGGKDLGDRQQPDGGRIAPRAFGRTPDARAHCRQSLRQPFDCHFQAPVSHASAPRAPQATAWSKISKAPPLTGVLNSDRLIPLFSV